MGGQAEVGRIWGIPVVIDGSFPLLALLYLSGYMTAGDGSYLAFGMFVTAGIAGSILVHELAHAGAGWMCSHPASHVELNGLGGLCYFASGRVRSNRHNIAISLAGPASNLVLWATFEAAAWASALLPETYGSITGIDRLSWFFETLAYSNFWMFWFNLLPSFPLDGGNALAAMLSERMESYRAKAIVARLGMGVAALCVYLSLSEGWWMLILAYLLFVNNRVILDLHGRPPWTRWN